jgi:biopolymer transport protein ExbD
LALSVGGSGDGPKADINITPLVDVVLVLLIIFMVVTPMLQKGVEVKLPQSKRVVQSKDQSPLIITVTDKKELYVDKTIVKPEELTAKVKDEMEALPGRTILLKGDRSLKFGEVRKAMDMIRKAGNDGISLATEKMPGVPEPEGAQ